MFTKNCSIQTKILLSIASVILIILGFSTWYTAKNEKTMVQQLVREKASDIAKTYFDGINTMMLTGTMQQSETLRQKALSHDDINEVRLIRAKGISDFYGVGSDSQKIIDELDQQAINGDKVTHYGENERGRVVTIIEPIFASSDFRGTNCLNCHLVDEGTVLGAVRVSYSLANLDASIEKALLLVSIINTVLFILGMLLVTLLMRKIVVNPLAGIRDTMGKVEKNSDLGLRLPVTRGDEIGQLSSAFNSMLSNFSSSLGQVSQTSSQLDVATNKISGIAQQTMSAAIQQHSETESVINAITELESSVQEVRDGANDAANASIKADKVAENGANTTKNAIDGIYGLVNEIEKASKVIVRLDEKSNGVGTVLDVIKGLAEQTNLLALNAAIEAARAGEQGRGFAVVADEVRTLATRSHEATEEIENIVDQLQKEAKDAVSVMNTAKESAEQRRQQVQSADEGLNLIADRVAHIRDLNSTMASVADNQSNVAKHVSQSVDNINSLAERTSGDAEQTNVASEELVELTKQLTDLVNQFKR